MMEPIFPESAALEDELDFGWLVCEEVATFAEDMAAGNCDRSGYRTCRSCCDRAAGNNDWNRFRTAQIWWIVSGVCVWYG